MLKLLIVEEEYYDEVKQEFLTSEGICVELEHSLNAISKWEARYEKPFLTQTSKTADEILAYVRDMILVGDIPDKLLHNLSMENLDQVNSYINSPQSATTFREIPSRGGRGEIITSELIYYWMVSFNIPFECQYWHINRLFSLIRICNVKNSKQKKMSKHEIATRNRELNEQRRAALNTSG